MHKDMKITVCFRDTKIIVPCDRKLPVRELVQQAIVRYRKVTLKVSTYLLITFIRHNNLYKFDCFNAFSTFDYNAQHNSGFESLNVNSIS